VYSLAAYGHMVADQSRTDAYVRALEREIRIGDVVAEIGTGTGIFALLACRYGARRVYAFEPSAIIELAREIAAANGLADRIEFIPKMSTESSLPEPVNLVVSDVRGVLPLFARSLGSIIDARERFLAPNGRMIPRCDTLWIAGVQAPELYREQLGPWNGKPYGFDMSAGRLRTVNSGERCYLTADQLLLPPQRLATLDYSTITQQDLNATVSWTVEKRTVEKRTVQKTTVDKTTVKPAAQGHGIVLWFDSVLAEGVTLTNRPGAPRLIYRQQFFPWPEPLEVCPGDTVTVTVSARLVGNDYVWRWDTQLVSGSSPHRAKPPFRQSTFFGSDFSFTELRTSASQFQPRLNEDGLIHRRVFSLMEGNMSLEAIAHELVRDFPKRFQNWQDGFNLVASISRNFAC
jgi:type I protein arginine methyltransferase